VISVVIPVLNEAARLPALLAALTAEPVARETIVVDGGSTDGSAAAAAASGADLVLRTPRGRGVQVAAGAARAQGGIVLFLHADTALPPGALVALQRLMEARPAVVGGNFRLLFDGGDEMSRWVERFYASIRRFGWFYGDSGIFIRRAVLQEIGGVRPLALMEDWDLVRRMRAAGRIACIAEPPLVSSSRRFAGRGRGAVLAGWVRIHLLYWAGMAPERLALLYDSARERGG
jgi:rSAM/selenodomain-associated transferase 2